MATLAGTGDRESNLLLLSSCSIKECVCRMNTTTRALEDERVLVSKDGIRKSSSEMRRGRRRKGHRAPGD